MEDAAWDAIFKFKRYEDSSLSYTGINRHEGEDIGGWDTVIKREEYERLFFNQQATMEAPKEVPAFTVAAPAPEKKIVAPAAPRPQPTAAEKKPDPVTSTYGIKPPAAPVKPKTEEPKAPAFDFSKVQIGAAVAHKSFGEGTITWMDQARKYVRVKFSAGDKTFTMESAFVQGHVSLK